MSRGIDFRNVACVLNFDLPLSAQAYVHRIGRTARAGHSGMALSFMIPPALYRKHPPTSNPLSEHDESVLQDIIADQTRRGASVQPYSFDMKQVDAFRYRMNDALRAVTPSAIRAARARELRQELLKSEKLTQHFEDNPDELRHLRHDVELADRRIRVQSHLRHVPEYLMPNNHKRGGPKDMAADVGFVPLRKETDNRIRRAHMLKRARGGFKGKGKGKGKNAGGRANKADPLRSFHTKTQTRH